MKNWLFYVIPTKNSDANRDFVVKKIQGFLKRTI